MAASPVNGVPDSSSSGAASRDPEPPNAPSPVSARMVVLLGTMVALGPLAIDMYLPAFADIAASLETDLAAVQFTLSVFLGAIAIGQAFYGPLADRWGRRRPLLWGLALFSISGAACALAQTIEALTAARAFMALGAAAGMVVSRAVVRDRCEIHDMARVFSLLMLIIGVAPILGPSLGGLLLTFTGWRGIFWVLAACGTLCLLASVRWLPESLPPSRRSRGGLKQAIKVYATLCVDPWFAVHAAIAGAASFALFGYVASAPGVFLELHTLSPQAFSILFGLNAGALIGAAQLNRWLLRHWAPRQLVVAASTLQAASTLALLLLDAFGWNGLFITEIAIVLCLGSIGIIFPNVGALVLAPFAHVAGSASALQGSTQFAFGALAGSVVGILHDSTARPMAVVLAAGSLTAFLLAWGSRHWGNMPPSFATEAS